ncbi:FKBP-type peptidyl-prolyl cis-trans isomerase [Cryobacterium sp. TMT1-21]|uniref:peptidylprolyl isomerase n=1 Tax=Cryobacterium shii TaxID=1259235 RepID=A0AAQ2C6E2_9MICO|nr:MULTISPECIES: FKBP-type peptidyl-prolyl cis-trans isomerase [Cryobacterium]TFC47094.1 FKBP-type peptidyl-prolyl cis-trans isomerase [Cryobacterium shii]TFC88199.1 FKBP-type peptidyl-prolyl cis-trans isomerase [Cryobacterium sp. TmT2-59]TFD13079.1 FKBP-type peptidyl-prolyl cis-trans isomerase [Cryobacterium sp. TMT4-10]TFD13827.1 FKBP-type peptidyl-prolyl cis-trans isomerase [Cryobacterium sp. TMT1-21]TFD16980.1 FKBP-type peptidyl-prolyl cis-trans isomerase [Cryobacterium sp. TMT2-23]
MRKLPALISVATVAVLALAGCSASPSTDKAAGASSISCTDSGKVSDSVKVAGKANAEPTVKFSKPLSTKTTERSVITEGKGGAVKTGDVVELAFAVYNATTGEKMNAGGYGDAAGASITLDEKSGVFPAIIKGVACSNYGARVAVVSPPADAFGGAGNADLKVGAKDNIIFVIDVKGQIPTRASGKDQKPQDGFPTVALAKDGAPTVTIPKADAPADLKTEVLKKGDGRKVAEGATVTVQYSGVVWSSGKVFDQSWGKGGPTPMSLSSVVPGFAQGLVGQTVGSQVVIIIPPALGYGDAGQTQAGITGTDTLVFVVDILAAGKA